MQRGDTGNGKMGPLLYLLNNKWVPGYVYIFSIIKMEWQLPTLLRNYTGALREGVAYFSAMN